MGTGQIAGQVHEERMNHPYAADAGVEDAIWNIQSLVVKAPTGCNDPEEWQYGINVNGSTVDVDIEFIGDDTFRVISTTTGADSATAVESYVKPFMAWRSWSRCELNKLRSSPGNLICSRNIRRAG